MLLTILNATTTRASMIKIHMMNNFQGRFCDKASPRRTVKADSRMISDLLIDYWIIARAHTM